MLAFVSLLWCTEALPLFVTSMLVPLLTVVLRILVDKSQDPPHRLTAQEAAPKIFGTMFSQVPLPLLTLDAHPQRRSLKYNFWGLAAEGLSCGIGDYHPSSLQASNHSALFLAADQLPLTRHSVLFRS